ncbi:MAG: mannose-1-phosphate guanylyltransferase/mannose-6-phosphate isomerase [Rhodospirillaceae bacterium]|jgi:mannose-1-phosphate guanylyltransferase / mannose-6-phosphate isomerase|nr:mannose-1-phosphate guanylyltransferase/mannose-6-phosphate isomerase [Rhodospirillales bacterium]MBT3905140.1 mannose-1-phosphate guanylyltransferase/mannose-6-phosphate isomerase [Rhodospirillaceae bacterium]MBT4702439.1 mannose-1-phosphate guanylyltransferase/mannose-6-phosphate isomerase [Rhodospirillaceae bacterium]MBT5034841.1 mannose-1-phosphate guanylyltransferase/mannose-6-phosphate isomerase [Rhodospirillaceae bacterium]MBT6219690.1 mannose-1-phosphate guanylyltransferase/mannose-6
MTILSKIIPIILSGGSGTRLWPQSRNSFPKQLLPFVSDHSLLQETALRLTEDQIFARPVVVCNLEHRFLILDQLREVSVEPADVIVEPTGRNTAPAAAVAALCAVETDPEAILFLLPSDHAIQNQAAFLNVVNLAAASAKAGHLVTFGIEPHAPETGYGYINKGAPLNGLTGCCAVESFVEKPDVKTAEGYLETGSYLWNSGMFVFRAGVYLEELERLNPAILTSCRKALAAGGTDENFQFLDKNAFSESPSLSIDYAVMEHTDKAAVVPADMGWSDVGTWKSLWQATEKDTDGNVLKGDVLSINSKNSYISSQDQLVAVVDLEDIAVIETEDAVLVMPLDKSQDVRDVVKRLKSDGREDYLTHPRVYRPWGNYKTMDKDEGFQVKRLTVNPGQRLSLQKHQHRTEHWTVVDGIARITIGTSISDVMENNTVLIPAGTVHRLENITSDPLVVIEVQYGSYLGEDDIERLEDDYGQAMKIPPESDPGIS